jgi:integrase
MLGLLLGCGLRRSEVVGLNLDQLQSREGHWPQVHSLYFYNVAAGAIVSTIRSPNLVGVARGQIEEKPIEFD